MLSARESIPTYLRGDIWIADLSLNVGSEQGGVRPCLITQNNIGNRFSPTVTIAPLTTSNEKKIKPLPTHVFLPATLYGLDYDSVVMLEQLKTVDKLVLMNKVAHLNEKQMIPIDEALMVSQGLSKYIIKGDVERVQSRW